MNSKLAILIGLSLLLAACGATEAPTPQVVKVEVPGPQPTPQIITVEKEVPGPTVSVPSQDCLGALEAADAYITLEFQWIEALTNEQYKKADRIVDQQNDALDAYITASGLCRSQQTSY